MAREAARIRQEQNSNDYLAFVKSLVDWKQLGPVELITVAVSPSTVNPCDFAKFAKDFPEQQIHVHDERFKELLKKDLNWPAIQESIKAMVPGLLQNNEIRNEARREAEEIRKRNSVGGLWCGLFDHDIWLAHWRIPDLRFAYRGPTLFLSTLRRKGIEVAFLFTDEQICFQPPAGAINEVPLVYVCTHGECGKSGYGAYLHKSVWQPGKTRFGAELPIVMVFDTCNLTEGIGGWEKSWADTLRGGSVRLLLGFQGLASIDPASSQRGSAFAENLLPERSMTLADAWIDAVRSHRISDHAIAIGVGESPSDAQAMLDLTLRDVTNYARVPRLGLGSVFFCVRDLDETRVLNTPY